MANVFTIPASAPFAETLGRGLIDRTGATQNPLALADVTLYLPTRRAARSLTETFARALGGAALLPAMRPLGDVDEEDFLFEAGAEALTLPPAISPMRRVLLLARLVRQWDEARRGERMPFAQAVALSRALASFLDEVETQGCGLAELESLAPDAFAKHWADVKTFLGILRGAWPQVLAEEGRMNPAARRNLALSSLARKLLQHPPSGLIVGAGSTGSIPATAELLRAIMKLPNGMVVLPGLDQHLDRSTWNGLDAGHPQYGLKQLLRRLGVEREDVREFNAVATQRSARERLVRETLRPAPTTDAWRALAEEGDEQIAEGLFGLSLVEAAHPGEEAAAIALILRHALEPDDDGRIRTRSAALVTPDRKLARRVAMEMRRWIIEIDDSAGHPLANAPAGTFLCLLAEAASERFAPAPLLALLKHPLAAGGQSAKGFRYRVCQFDRECMRGPRPDAGLSGSARAIAAAIGKAEASNDEIKLDRLRDLAVWFDGIREILRPLEQIFSENAAALADILASHVSCAEALASDHTESGASRLWRGEAGEAAAKLIAEMEEAAVDLPAIETASYPVLFRAFAGEKAVRPPFGAHPRLAILGPLEARLQAFDLVVLGGLNEGSWPAAAATDPWLSRPMREHLGLESPERRIGLAAHDFATLACAPRVILTRALKAEGAPTIASRWLQRLQQLTKGLEIASHLKAQIPYAALAAVRDQPTAAPKRMGRPQPKPPAEARPRALSVTEIETWLRDPYAIYAKHVLRLKPLEALDAQIGPLQRGSIVHAALEQFLKEYPGTLPADAHAQLIAIASALFAANSLPRAAVALWQPRFINAARWFIEEERLRRSEIAESYLEIAGACSFETPAGPFTLRGRADRIDVLQNGTAAIIDYKTGQLPSQKQVKLLLTPQLPLEALILAQGGFADAGELATSKLYYIRFGGGAEPGELRDISDVSQLVAQADANLRMRLADYSDPETPYLPRVMPFRSDMPGDYDHLSRVGEWALAGWEEVEE